MTEFDEAPQYGPYLLILSQTAEQTMSLIRARNVKRSVARKFPMLQQIVKQAWHQLDVGDCPPSLGKVGTEIAKGNERRIKKRSRYESKSNPILRSRSRHGRDSGGGRKGRSDPRYLHDERRHSVEARRSREPPGTGDVRGGGESKRGRLVDPAKVSRGHGLGLALPHCAYQGVVIQGKFTHTFEGA